MLNDISVLLICLNDEDSISTSIESMMKSELREIIVIDGGSSDKTLEIVSKLPVELIQSEMGMATQMKAGISAAKGSLIFMAESDHFYPKHSINKLADELEQFNADGVQGRLVFQEESNFFEKGHKEFIRIHNKKPGRRDMISGSQIWKSNKLIKLLNNINGGESYSFDTERAEAIKRLNLKTYVGKTKIIDNGKVDFNKFIARHINYGNGDYNFFIQNKENFKFLRKVKSLTHVFVRYGFSYPFKGLFNRRFYIIIPYMWLVCLVRYTGFFISYLRKIRKTYT